MFFIRALPVILRVFGPIILVILAILGVLAAIFRGTAAATLLLGERLYQLHPFLAGIYLCGFVVTGVVSGGYAILGGKSEDLVIPFIAAPFWPIFVVWQAILAWRD